MCLAKLQTADCMYLAVNTALHHVHSLPHTRKVLCLFCRRENFFAFVRLFYNSSRCSRGVELLHASNVKFIPVALQ